MISGIVYVDADGACEPRQGAGVATQHRIAQPLGLRTPRTVEKHQRYDLRYAAIKQSSSLRGSLFPIYLYCRDNKYRHFVLVIDLVIVIVIVRAEALDLGSDGSDGSDRLDEFDYDYDYEHEHEHDVPKAAAMTA